MCRVSCDMSWDVCGMSGMSGMSCCDFERSLGSSEGSAGSDLVCQLSRHKVNCFVDISCAEKNHTVSMYLGSVFEDVQFWKLSHSFPFCKGVCGTMSLVSEYFAFQASQLCETLKDMGYESENT